MEGPRAVRIPRATVREEAPRVRVPRTPVEGPPSPAPRAEGELRPNVAGTRRVVRLTLLYVLTLALVFLAFALYDRTVPRGSSSGAVADLLVFGLSALALALGGAWFTLSTAPRAVAASPTAVLIVGRWGRRTEWPPIGETTVRVVRRYPAGFLAPSAVESVELIAPGLGLRSYLVEAGLLPATGPDTAR